MSPTAVIARIRLNPHSRAVQRDLRDATQMHRTVMRLAPDNLGNSPRHTAGLLYRIDESSSASVLLVQAQHIDAHRLPADYGHAEIKDLAPMFAALRKGMAVNYRIVVNPVIENASRWNRKTSVAASSRCPGPKPTSGGYSAPPPPDSSPTSSHPPTLPPPRPAASTLRRCGTASSATTAQPPSPTPTLSPKPSSRASAVERPTAPDSSASPRREPGECTAKGRRYA